MRTNLKPGTAVTMAHLSEDLELRTAQYENAKEYISALIEERDAALKENKHLRIDLWKAIRDRHHLEEHHDQSLEGGPGSCQLKRLPDLSDAEVVIKLADHSVRSGRDGH